MNSRACLGVLLPLNNDGTVRERFLVTSFFFLLFNVFFYIFLPSLSSSTVLLRPFCPVPSIPFYSSHSLLSFLLIPFVSFSLFHSFYCISFYFLQLFISIKFALLSLFYSFYCILLILLFFSSIRPFHQICFILLIYSIYCIFLFFQFFCIHLFS